MCKNQLIICDCGCKDTSFCRTYNKSVVKKHKKSIRNEKELLYLRCCFAQHKYRKRLAIPCNRIWTIRSNGKSDNALTGYYMGSRPHYSRKCEHNPFLFIRRQSRAGLQSKNYWSPHFLFCATNLPNSGPSDKEHYYYGGRC